MQSRGYTSGAANCECLIFIADLRLYTVGSHCRYYPVSWDTASPNLTRQTLTIRPRIMPPLIILKAIKKSIEQRMCKEDNEGDLCPREDSAIPPNLRDIVGLPDHQKCRRRASFTTSFTWLKTPLRVTLSVVPLRLRCWMSLAYFYHPPDDSSHAKQGHIHPPKACSTAFQVVI